MKTPLETSPQTMARDLIDAGQLQHIAVIMDGNRRWAKEHHMMSVQGHYHGYQALRDIVSHCADVLNLPVLTVYAFSTENWNRSETEVSFLTGLLKQTLAKEIQSLIERNIRIRFIGHLEAFPEALRKQCEEAEARAANNTGMIFQVALNYGGRSELVNACRAIAQDVQNGQLSPEAIDEAIIQQHLYTADVPDPDLLIRTGGDYRISNFLLWQAAYAELFITQAYWPDFTPQALDKAIAEFQHRQRRFGR